MTIEQVFTEPPSFKRCPRGCEDGIPYHIVWEYILTFGKEDRKAAIVHLKSLKTPDSEWGKSLAWAINMHYLQLY